MTSVSNNKYNNAFLNAYIELDKICCQKFGVVSGGITDYINRLINARFAPGRDDVLPRLVQYRNIRNRMAHEAGALQSITEITKSDLKWINEFVKLMEKKADPISLYLKKARKYAKRRRAKKLPFILAAIVIVLAACVVVAYHFVK